MEKIRTLIVDDELLARRGIRAQLKEEADIEIVAECGNGRDAIKVIEEQKPDLVFLDIQMPELDGFSVIEAIYAERLPAVIFVTAYDKYALRAFEVHALDYLLKPFDTERFRQTTARARQQIETPAGGDFERRLLALVRTLKPPPHPLERFVIKSGGRVFFVRADE